MNDHEWRIENIIIKYGAFEPLTNDEQAELDEWRSRSAEHFAMPDQFRDPEWVRERLDLLRTIPTEKIWAKIRENLTENFQRKDERVMLIFNIVFLACFAYFHLIAKAWFLGYGSLAFLALYLGLPPLISRIEAKRWDLRGHIKIIGYFALAMAIFINNKWWIAGLVYLVLYNVIPSDSYLRVEYWMKRIIKVYKRWRGRK